jgi:hypothetical protein
MGSVRLSIVFLSLVGAVGFPATQPAIRAFALGDLLLGKAPVA